MIFDVFYFSDFFLLAKLVEGHLLEASKGLDGVPVKLLKALSHHFLWRQINQSRSVHEEMEQAVKNFEHNMGNFMWSQVLCGGYQVVNPDKDGIFLTPDLRRHPEHDLDCYRGQYGHQRHLLCEYLLKSTLHLHARR